MAERTDLAHLLLSANRAMEQAMLRRLEVVGVPGLRMGHLTVLRVLPANGSARVSELADAAGVTRQAIAQVVADLVQLGVVEVRVDETDRRARSVAYTDYGRRGYRTAMGSFGQIEHEIAAAVGPRRMSTLKSALQTVATAAARAPDTRPAGAQ